MQSSQSHRYFALSDCQHLFAYWLTETLIALAICENTQALFEELSLITETLWVLIGIWKFTFLIKDVRWKYWRKILCLSVRYNRFRPIPPPSTILVESTRIGCTCLDTRRAVPRRSRYNFVACVLINTNPLGWF